MVGVLAMAVLICREEAVFTITVIFCMLNYTAWKTHGILHSTLGMVFKFKMYHVFQNFPNGLFTRLKGVWLIAVNMLALCLGGNVREVKLCV